MITDLSANVTALGSELVDLRLCNVSPLLCFLQLMLYLAQLAQICIGLFLLKKIKMRVWKIVIELTHKEANGPHFRKGMSSIFAYSLLCRSLVGFNFQLQLIHQALQTAQILFVFLRLVN